MIAKINGDRALELARDVLETEADAVHALAQRLDESFLAAVELLLACKGRVVVSGIGKSGHIARKLAATLASTGTPAFFVHPADASHGDLGMVTAEDVFIALSYSGETAELVSIIPLVKRTGARLIALTGRTDSSLALLADVHLDARVEREACPHNLAPTASTTATLGRGDARAVGVLEARGFTASDFARSHPGGSLGRRMFLRVEDIMRRGPDLPRSAPIATLAQGLLEMSRKGLGMTVVVDGEDAVLGVFTDGDLRRLLDRQVDIHALLMQEVMTVKCRTIGPQELAAAGAHLMDQHRITVLPVVADGHLLGAFNVHDLLRAGVM